MLGKITGWGSITLENHRSYFRNIWKWLRCQWLKTTGTAASFKVIL